MDLFENFKLLCTIFLTQGRLDLEANMCNVWGAYVDNQLATYKNDKHELKTPRGPSLSKPPPNNFTQPT